MSDLNIRSESLNVARARSWKERREAISAFTRRSGEHWADVAARQPKSTNAGRRDFIRYLSDGNINGSFEARAMGMASGYSGAGSTNSGGNLVPPGWFADVIHYTREYDGLIRDMELFLSAHGAQVTRPAYSQYSSAAAQTENSTVTEYDPTIGQQSWPVAQTLFGEFTASNQLVADSSVVPVQELEDGSPYYPVAPSDADGLDLWITYQIGEQIGRKLAAIAQPKVYAAISAANPADGSASGGYLALGTASAITVNGTATTELAAKTISVDSAARMLACLDPSFIDSAAFYMTLAQWSGIARQQDANGAAMVLPNGQRVLWDVPVCITSQTTAATASTVCGPILASLSDAFSLRIVNNPAERGLLKSSERFAEYAQTYYRGTVRADVAVRNPDAVVGVKYAAT